MLNQLGRNVVHSRRFSCLQSSDTASSTSILTMEDFRDPLLVWARFERELGLVEAGFQSIFSGLRHSRQVVSGNISF
ncbi:hypothetical protein DPMN_037540 [Dreissena polymorpha]|uniref:Uncharacterized protein n=1 Tax=Dreissena polymorpha TaxID=45954 RepID=A0A9D4MCX7_DREPO|nr:hypothetical protein DPMN_037540 [Dreissena polymorpha]